jgi:hypothetical protein
VCEKPWPFRLHRRYGSVIAVNPLLIILLLPAITAFTMHIGPFQMILVGSFISAGSVFILVLLPDLVPSASKLLLISR